MRGLTEIVLFSFHSHSSFGWLLFLHQDKRYSSNLQGGSAGWKRVAVWAVSQHADNIQSINHRKQLRGGSTAFQPLMRLAESARTRCPTCIANRRKRDADRQKGGTASNRGTNATTKTPLSH